MSEDLVYLELTEDYGRAPSHLRLPDGSEVENPRAGELDTIGQLAVDLSVPTMIGKDVIEVSSKHIVYASEKRDEVTNTRVIPNSRVVETGNPQVTNALMAHGVYRQCDPPKGVQARKPKSKTKAADGQEA